MLLREVPVQLFAQLFNDADSRDLGGNVVVFQPPVGHVVGDVVIGHSGYGAVLAVGDADDGAVALFKTLKVADGIVGFAGNGKDDRQGIFQHPALRGIVGLVHIKAEFADTGKIAGPVLCHNP